MCASVEVEGVGLGQRQWPGRLHSMEDLQALLPHEGEGVCEGVTVFVRV